MKQSDADELAPAESKKAKAHTDAPQSAAELLEQIAELQSKTEELEEQLQQSKDKELRNLADYQNLVRRTQDDRARLIKMATQDLAEELLQPLDHLSLAAQQLNDNGLNMVVDQLWQVLNRYGLAEIEVLGQKFDPTTMEVVDQQGEGEVVTSVVKKGYTLNGDVIQYAKVIVSDPTTN